VTVGAIQPGLVRLLISCPDRPGIVANVSRFLYEAGANIVSSAQYSTDPSGGTFFLRMEFTVDPDAGSEGLAERFGLKVAEPLGMTWRMWDAAQPKRITVMVSRYDHCLLDLLWRCRRHQLDAQIVMVISNHPDLREDAALFDVPYHHIPVEKDRKLQAEARQLELLEGCCDVVVLARYMQVLSPEFLDRVGVPVINIHHSFLPAFAGADPYRRAFERGVKIIGATAHYVTEELDAGPIIEQDVARVTHRESPGTMMRIGRDIERTVLARAVNAHLEDRVLVHGHRTVVF
jgi:formyltetrahydrofolate deformylase